MRIIKSNEGYIKEIVWTDDISEALLLGGIVSIRVCKLQIGNWYIKWNRKCIPILVTKNISTTFKIAEAEEARSFLVKYYREILNKDVDIKIKPLI